jgi:pimeloyl-ACP methyl ester carboxylesterase
MTWRIDNDFTAHEKQVGEDGGVQSAESPRPVFVMSHDGLKIATYEWGPTDAQTVVLVHGFASSAILNWERTGWVRDLTRAGFHVIALDQRGHGASDKPHDSSAYSMGNLVADLLAVMDTYMINVAKFGGYSLGARVGWQAALDLPDRISRAVLGGIPDGDPLTRFRVDDARAFIADGSAVDDKLTRAYLEMADGIPGNDLTALVALVEGMRGGLQPDPANPPGQPLLFATGSEDRIVEASRNLAAATPRGRFFEIPKRNHFNAPTSRSFRDAALTFLRDEL